MRSILILVTVVTVTASGAFIFLNKKESNTIIKTTNNTQPQSESYINNHGSHGHSH